MVHRKAKLTPLGRLELVMRVVRDGWPVARVAEGSVVSRQTVHTWVRRYRAEGLPGLEDRSSRPKYSPRRLSPDQEGRILAARRSRRWGPDRLGPALRLPSSTVYAVLARNHCSRLTDFDRPTGRPIRYQRERPGELVHLDIKKLGRIPSGGGHRMLGREAGRKNYYKTQHLGNDYLHVAVDDATRLAFVRCYQEDTGAATTRFLLEATAFFARQGIAIQAVMTDNAKAYTVSKLFRTQVSALGLKHLVTKPFRPCTNGKAERFIRTLLNEWAYSQLYRSNVLRLQQLPRWVYFYNSRRHHTALGGSPMAAVKKVLGDYS
jgi:transposase InsO family protein